MHADSSGSQWRGRAGVAPASRVRRDLIIFKHVTDIIQSQRRGVVNAAGKKDLKEDLKKGFLSETAAAFFKKRRSELVNRPVEMYNLMNVSGEVPLPL